MIDESYLSTGSILLFINAKMSYMIHLKLAYYTYFQVILYFTSYYLDVEKWNKILYNNWMAMWWKGFFAVTYNRDAFWRSQLTELC